MSVKELIVCSFHDFNSHVPYIPSIIIDHSSVTIESSSLCITPCTISTLRYVVVNDGRCGQG
jgi:hypothetical protein